MIAYIDFEPRVQQYKLDAQASASGVQMHSLARRACLVSRNVAMGK